ncbi:single-stranded-DNA-specific exonuclease RecJ [Eubacteriaceae bacterium ES3]|nr:single-stranded-DNA-specific exonuclease RecJ [Eubacteriaceae bacterium ES3]
MIATKWHNRKKNSDINITERRIEYSEQLGIDPIIADILIGRGITSLSECEQYLYPKISDSNDPFLLPDMQLAVDRILTAKNKQEKIILYGDYDVDGTVGVSILYMFLRKISCNVEYYIPNRLKTGYGLHMDPLNDLIEDGMNLLVTVDNGISSIREIEFLNQSAVDVIITDHHECHGELPGALAIINPKRPDSLYPFKGLCGAGVSFKLIQALVSALNIDVDLQEYIECVSVATVSDLVPLKDENRLLVKEGLKFLNQDPKNMGLRKLIEISELEEIKAWHYGFILGPKINAAGRLGEAHKIVSLLTTNDSEKAYSLAAFLSDENRKRQELEKEILEKAMTQIEEKKLYERDLILVYGEGWHSGVIGIVASRIQEKYYRPVIVIGIENDLGKGSCRSVEGFDIFKALSACGDIYKSFGGHEQAAGLSIKKENIAQLEKRLEDYTIQVGLKNLLVAPVYFDIRMNSDAFNIEWYGQLDKIEPTGIGNPGINFLIDGSNIKKFGRMGKEKDHLWIDFNGIRAVGFWMAEFYELLLGVTDYKEINLIVKPSINEFNGIKSLQLQIKDIKRNPLENHEQAKIILSNIINQKVLNRWQITTLINGIDPEEVAITLPELRAIYKYLKQFNNKELDFSFFENCVYSPFKILSSIEILRENDLLTIKSQNEFDILTFIPTNEKKDIQNSNLMIKLKKIKNEEGE